MALDHDSKRIVRQWNREIEDETRRLAAQAEREPWRGVVWAVLWICWMLLVGGLVGAIRLQL